MDDRRDDARKNIERSIEIFTEENADNYIPHLRIIRFLIDKESLPPSQALPWMVGSLSHALDIREYFDVYWALSAITYVLLVGATAARSCRLPTQVSLAATIRGSVGENLEYGQSAYMCALVHDEVNCLLAQSPRRDVIDAKELGRQWEVWAFVRAVLGRLTSIESVDAREPE